MYQKIGKDGVDFSLFNKPNIYGESEVAPADTLDDAQTVSIEASDTAEVNVDADAPEVPSITVDIPVEPGSDTVESVNVEVEYAEALNKIDKATKFHESLIDELEAGAGAVIDGDSIKVGATEIMPETENKADGEVTLGDMNEERIEPEQTIIDSDHATMDDK